MFQGSLLGTIMSFTIFRHINYSGTRSLGSYTCAFLSVTCNSTTFRSFSSDPIPSFSNSYKLERLLLTKPKLDSVKFEEPLTLFRRMLKMMPLPPVDRFNRVLVAFVEMKEYFVSISLFKDMCVLAIPVDRCTINIIINCFCHLNEVDYGFSLLGGIIKRGFSPNVVTYTTLLRGLISQGKSVEAERLFKKLVVFNEIKPDVVTLNTIIVGLRKTGHTSIAVRLFRSMDMESCAPDAISYNTVIDCFCKHGYVDRALILLYEMTKKGISPNVITYNSLIHALCNLDRWADTRRLLREMVIRNISPDVYTYNVLINAYGKARKTKDAENVIKLMIQRGQYPDVVTYTALMHGYCLHGDINEALSVLNTMRRKGLSPNTRCYNILIYGCCKNLKVDEAIDLFQDMPFEGLTPTIEICSRILQGLFHVGRHFEAQKFFKEMMPNHGVTLDTETCNTLLHDLCRKRYVVEALSLFHIMEGDDVIYNTLIRGCLQNKKYKEGCVLLDEMHARGISADNSTTSMLMDLLK